MRSIFAKLTLWFFATLLVSLAAFLLTTVVFAPRPVEQRRAFGPFHRLENALAIEAYERGGKEELARTLERFDSLLPNFAPGHRLLDGAGRDLLTGEDLSAQLPRAGDRGQFGNLRSPDGRYIYIFPHPPRPNPLSMIPFYAWIALLVALMAWVFARYLGNPLRELRETVRRFGNGDLSPRTHSRRRDEIGDLARDFDQMADRIETLLTAERRLLQDVSHELRTPLTRLSLALTLSRYSQAQEEIGRLSSLIGELTEMTRAEGDPEALPRQPFNLSDLLASEAALFEIDLRVQPGLIIQGRPAHLRRAVENILQNAARFQPPGSKIIVSAAREDDGVTIRIRDFGPGVPPESLDALFRPFFRVDKDRSRDSGGAGLGLAIAQRAVRLHHGQIVARNASPGLEIIITLPD
ncbi:MAG: HAMP domain-containing protein [Acidobacteria bacterium]|nr:HAMP domain-containing protein [Acidobacteriota bacterium]